MTNPTPSNPPEFDGIKNPTPSEFDAKLDAAISKVRWGDYQHPNGTWGYGVANRDELKAAIRAAVREIVPKPDTSENKNYDEQTMGRNAAIAEMLAGIGGEQ